SLLTINYSIMAQSNVEAAPLQETYKQNPFTLVYAGAITENVKGKVNIHPVTYKLNGLEIAANVYTPANYNPENTYMAITVAHPNGGIDRKSTRLNSSHVK